ncbi:MAG TPA: hypothetical protein VF916_02635 [Ktedonobacterales bacterium]
MLVALVLLTVAVATLALVPAPAGVQQDSLVPTPGHSMLPATPTPTGG